MMQHTLRRTARRARRGFTMIELIAVVAVIAILVGVAQMNFGATKEDAYQRAIESDAKNFMTAQEQHYNRQDRYMEAVTTATGELSTTRGMFRLSDDVGIRISGVTQNGYTAVFAHKKLTKMICTLAFTNAVGPRIICQDGQTLTVANYTFQES